MSLAAKLPWNHRFAGGFPGLSSQPLPTDADAIDYLSRMATADGAGVEVGVAVAVDAFFRGLKATPGLFDAIKASCILCGARTITGALVPLAGDAPTAQGGWASGDYSRTAGMTGDGNALYLDTNVANDSDFAGSVADPQNDNHNAVYITSVGLGLLMASSGGATGLNWIDLISSNVRLFSRSNATSQQVSGTLNAGLHAHSRGSSSSFQYYSPQGTGEKVSDSQMPNSANLTVFTYSNDGVSFFQFSTATIAFYSIGTDIESAGLAALDTAVTNLITAIGEAL